MVVLPLTNDPQQRFSINLFGQVYDMEISINTRTSVWGMSIFQNNLPVIYNIGLLGGVNVLSQYNLPLDYAFVINTDDIRLDPTIDNFGDTVRVVFLNEAEFQQIQEELVNSDEIENASFESGFGIG